MKEKNGISVGIIIPAYNEEQNLPLAVDAVLKEVPKVTKNFEIVIVDDGSNDGTGQVADRYAVKYRMIRVYHHPTNRGFSATFQTGLKKIRKDFSVIFPGDYDTSPVSLAGIIKRAGKGRMIVSYPANPESRSIVRRFISKSVVICFNLLFGMNLRYFTGTYICETKLLKSMNFVAQGLVVYAEAKIRAHRLGIPITEMPFVHIGRIYGNATAITRQNFQDTILTAFTLKREFLADGRLAK